MSTRWATFWEVFYWNGEGGRVLCFISLTWVFILTRTDLIRKMSCKGAKTFWQTPFVRKTFVQTLYVSKTSGHVILDEKRLILNIVFQVTFVQIWFVSMAFYVISLSGICSNCCCVNGICFNCICLNGSFTFVLQHLFLSKCHLFKQYLFKWHLF